MCKTLLSAVISYLLLQFAGFVIMFFIGFNFVFPNDISTDNGDGYYIFYAVIQVIIHVLWYQFNVTVEEYEEFSE